MENNICIIQIKYIKLTIKYLKFLILILIYSIPKIGFCTNEKTSLTNSNHFSKKLKDPTMPKTFKNSSNSYYNHNENDYNDDEQPLKLSVIMIKDAEKTVTINNQILREQDQIDGYKIITIEPNKVLLENLNTNSNQNGFFKKILSINNSSTTNLNEKFIELNLPNIIIKEPVEN